MQTRTKLPLDRGPVLLKAAGELRLTLLESTRGARTLLPRQGVYLDIRGVPYSKVMLTCSAPAEFWPARA